MVRKIQSNEYLKRYENMTSAERQEYADRVGRWLHGGGRRLVVLADGFDARLQNVIMAGMSWNDAESGAFEEGAILLSALVKTCDTWLPDMLYTKAVRRVVRQMTKCLKDFSAGQGKAGKTAVTNESIAITDKQKERIVKRYTDKVVLKKTETKTVSGKAFPSDTKTVVTDEKTAVETGVPVRPKHIDQYAHLLPKKTQERAAQVRDLLRDLDVARENARKLMDAGEQGDKVAQWAKKATQLDDKVRSIYAELDAEWEKLVKSGRVVVDVFGNASIAEGAQPVQEDSAPELTAEQKARRRELRKWLGDTRRGNGSTREKHVEKWRQNFKEYVSLEGDAAYKDEKIAEAAKHYEIPIGDISVK